MCKSIPEVDTASVASHFVMMAIGLVLKAFDGLARSPVTKRSDRLNNQIGNYPF